MLDRISAFFRSKMTPPPQDEGPTSGSDLRLAACALLLEIAYADDVFSEEEREHLHGAVRRQFGLDPEQTEELVQLADAERRTAVDLWRFTSLVREHYSKAQLMVLAEVMWGLVYADGELAEKEDYLMRKISNLLDLEPGYLAQARKRVEDGSSTAIDAREPD